VANAEVWTMVHRERAALADDLDGLTPEQWDAPSLCDEWTVRDLVAHMTASSMISPPAFFGKIIASGFSLTRMQEKDIARERGDSNADALARFRAQINSTKHPPGPTDTWLGEALIHSEDIRRPLGIAHEYDTTAAVRVAEFYKGSNLVVGAKKRIAGLHLQATDAEWTTGAGPDVSGPVVSLVLAMTGREQVLGDLSGDGVATLRERTAG
jgi:uncharacterized protein (TIGR03083 family)